MTVFTRAVNITLMMKAVNAPGNSANFYQTTLRNIPEGRHLRSRSYENLKSHV
jgi:hypothetical protein